MIYLASPYSSPDDTIMESRFHEVARCAARLMAVGVHLFCPITHTHPIACAGELPRGWDYWQQFDYWFISRCDALVVVRMDGWEESKGVEAEIQIAHQCGIPVLYVDSGEQIVDQFFAQVTAAYEPKGMTA